MKKAIRMKAVAKGRGQEVEERRQKAKGKRQEEEGRRERQRAGGRRGERAAIRLFQGFDRSYIWLQL
jgi:hypothetical protein